MGKKKDVNNDTTHTIPGQKTIDPNMRVVESLGRLPDDLRPKPEITAEDIARAVVDELERRGYLPFRPDGEGA
jgi:hypothetical protein